MFPKVLELQRSQTAKVTFKGHSRSMLSMPFDRSRVISYQSSVVTMSLSCIVFEILSDILHNLKRSRDSERIPFGGNLSCALVLVNVNVYTKFGMLSFTRSKRYDWGSTIKNRGT